MSFRIRIEVTRNAAEKLAKVPGALHDALDLAVRDVADEILAESQDLVPVDKGTLKKSGNVRYGDLEATIGYDTPYARFVHEGTAAHEILPRTPGGVLAFPPAGARGAIRGGRRVGIYKFGQRTITVGLVFAKRVMHPGTRAQPFLADAIRNVTPLLPELVIKRIREALDALAGP